MLWLMAKGLLALLAFLAVAYGLLLVKSPSGLFRKTLRETPLAAPIAIHRIEGDCLITASGSFTLAGVTLPTDPAHLARTQAFLQIATAQGIEVIRQVSPTASILRCEPRINHWCGNDPVAAHFEQHNLNELILAMGYATFNANDEVLTDSERERLSAAGFVAKKKKWGLWANDPSEDTQLSFENGLDQTHPMQIEEELRRAIVAEKKALLRPSPSSAPAPPRPAAGS